VNSGEDAPVKTLSGNDEGPAVRRGLRRPALEVRKRIGVLVGGA
jgi:hypothetical protein